MMRNLKSKHYSLFTIHSSLPLPLPRGLSLIEVLAAIFVVSIGLLGVLAVIPYGMYQTKRAAIAEHGGNLARATLAKFQLREWNKSDKIADSFCPQWIGADQGNTANPQNNNGASSNYVYSRDSSATPQIDYLNCTAPIIFDPIGVAANDSVASAYYSPSSGINIKAVQRVSLLPSVGATTHMTRTQAVKFCMGSDDLSYAPSNTDSGRTSLFTYDNVPLSKGDYSWFLTIQAKEFKVAQSSYGAVRLDEVDLFNIDALICYQRAPTSDTDRSFTPSKLTSYYKGGQVTLDVEPDLKDTKYVLLVGPESLSAPYRVVGRWYRIVSTATGSNFHMTLECPGGTPANSFQEVWKNAFGTNITLDSSTTPRADAAFRLVVIQGVINHLSVN